MARGLRPRMDARRHRTLAIRRQVQALGPVLARPHQRWHLYDLLEPSPDVLVLLDEIDRDPTCIFWG